MKLARLFAPVVVAVALVAPAHAAPALATDNLVVMQIVTPSGTLAPAANPVKKSEAQAIKNTEASTTHTVEVLNFFNHAITSGAQQIAGNEKKSFQPWAGQTLRPITQPLAYIQDRFYEVIVDGSLQGFITVLDD
jgi:cell pole-organizing protein PopZ